TEALVLEQLGRASPPPVLEAGLHRDHLLHRSAEPLRQRRAALLLADDAVRSFRERENRSEPFALELLREALDDRPQKHRVEERGRDGLVLANALVRVRQAEAHELERRVTVRPVED